MNYTVVGITVIIIVCLLIGITLFARQESFANMGETCDTYAQKACVKYPVNTPKYNNCFAGMKQICQGAKAHPNAPISNNMSNNIAKYLSGK